MRESDLVKKEIIVESGAIARAAYYIKKYAMAGMIGIICDPAGEAHFESVRASLTDAGYQISDRRVSEGAVYELASVSALQFSEGVRLIVGLGAMAASEAAKTAAGRLEVPCVIFPTDASSDACFLDYSDYYDRGTLVTSLCGKPSLVVVDKEVLASSDARRSAAGIGLLYVKYAALTDRIYENMIFSNLSENTALLKAALGIKEFWPEIRDVSSGEVAVRVLDKLRSVDEYLDEKNIKLSGAAYTLAWLISLYKKSGMNYNEYAFISAFTVMELYRIYLAGRCPDNLIPPDRDRAIRLLDKLCRIDYEESLLNIRRSSAKDYARRAFITRDYSEEIGRLSGEASGGRDAAKMYRRMIGSSGFELSGYISAEELLQLCSLAGEAAGGYPLLKHIKFTGMLETLLSA